MIDGVSKSLEGAARSGEAAAGGSQPERLRDAAAAGRLAPASGRAGAEERLMRRIFEAWHGHIAAAVSGSALPAEFLAALTANESGGAAEASCFEEKTYFHLKDVAAGRTAAFGSIGQQALFSVLQQEAGGQATPPPGRIAAAEFTAEARRVISAMQDKELRELATSWGLTQIMGYHLVGRKAAIHQLLDPQFHYQLAVDLLTEFARRFRLELSSSFEALFRCWNTGHPEGETFDPEYVPRGMRRLVIYRELLKGSESRPASHPPRPLGSKD